jgi:hypothetical protein
MFASKSVAAARASDTYSNGTSYMTKCLARHLSLCTARDWLIDRSRNAVQLLETAAGHQMYYWP